LDIFQRSLIATEKIKILGGKNLPRLQSTKEKSRKKDD
jgi:hypothetical protein